MNARSTLISHIEPTKLVEPRQRSLDDPAGSAQATPMVGPTFGQLRFDPTVMQRVAVWLGIVAAVALDQRVVDLQCRPRIARVGQRQRPRELRLRHAGVEARNARARNGFVDSVRLVPARALGMKTIWYNHGLGLSSHFKIDAPELHIDYETDDLAGFLQTIRI